jgi:hypothetical protein
VKRNAHDKPFDRCDLWKAGRSQTKRPLKLKSNQKNLKIYADAVAVNKHVLDVLHDDWVLMERALHINHQWPRGGTHCSSRHCSSLGFDLPEILLVSSQSIASPTLRQPPLDAEEGPGDSRRIFRPPSSFKFKP